MNTVNTFTTKDSCTWNITHNMGSAAVWNLQPEKWGSSLVQEKYHEEKACGDDDDNGNDDDDDCNNLMNQSVN